MPAPSLLPVALYVRTVRARSAVKKGIRYKIGTGGMNPFSRLPDDGSGTCDCSGFVAWVLGLSRKPKTARPFWIETTAMVNDANGKKRTFEAIKKPEAGCVVAYGDSNGKEGHCGIVTDVKFGPHGEIIALRGVDCSSGQSRRTGEAITERDLTWFLANRPTFMILKEDRI